MARHNPRPVEPVYEAAQKWRDQAFLNGFSVFFADRKLWTKDLFDELDRRFVQNLDAGDGNFLSKLHAQLAEGSPACKQLMAEIVWLVQLFSIKSNIGPDKKRRYVSEIWAWSGENLGGGHSLFEEDAMTGIGSTGTAYNISPWREIVLVIKAMQDFADLSDSERNRIATDPWEFAEWFSGQPDAQKRQFTHIIQHLLFPDFFERSTAKSDKCKILSYYNDEQLSDVKMLDTVTIDRQLLDLRKRLEKEYGERFDFYNKEHITNWKNQEDNGAPREATDRGASNDEIDFEPFTKIDFGKASKKFGDEEERRLRGKVLGNIKSLRNDLKPGAHVGVGHNSPPDEFILDENEILEVEQALDAIEDGMSGYAPKPGKVAQETFNLQNFLQRKNPWFWVGASGFSGFTGYAGGQFIDGLFGEFFKQIGVDIREFVIQQVMAKLPSLWAGFMNLISSIHEWLVLLQQALL